MIALARPNGSPTKPARYATNLALGAGNAVGGGSGSIKCTPVNVHPVAKIVPPFTSVEFPVAGELDLGLILNDELANLIIWPDGFVVG